MRGLGTIINALAIVIGGVLGILFKRFLKERYQDTIIKATGFSVVFLGAAGTLSKILTVRPDGTLSTGGSMVMILSLALGALLGELIDLDAQFERFGETARAVMAPCSTATGINENTQPLPMEDAMMSTMIKSRIAFATSVEWSP